MNHRIGVIAVVSLAVTASLAVGGILDQMHPDFDLKEVPLADKYKTMGMGFLSDGRMVLTTSEFIGGGEVPKTASIDHKVLIVTNPGSTTPTVKEVSNTWLQPVGLTIVNDKVYVSDRDGFYAINDIVAPADLTKNRTKIASWPDTTTWAHGYTWHQFVFDPVYWQGNFYAPYSGSIRPGGPSDSPASTSYSGSFLKWGLDGKLNKYAGGLRSPNGVNIGPNGDMFVADNQGSWLPSSTFAQMKPGKFYGHKQSPVRDSTGKITKDNGKNWAEDLPYERPTAWLDHGNLRSSPSQPIYMDKTIYEGDWLLGDVNNPGLVRIGLDDVEGTYNGTVFWFGKGFGNTAINRMAWGKDGALYVGSIMKIAGNWPGGDKTAIFRVTAKTAATVFDMKGIRHLADGVEITFTQPVDPASIAAANFPVQQWNYVRQEAYGKGKSTPVNITPSSTALSADGKRVHLILAGMKDDYVHYFKLGAVKSATGATLWNNEAWMTLNKLSTRAWNATVSISEKPKTVSSLDALVRQRVTGAGVELSFDLPGNVVASLRSLSGAQVRTGRGAGSLVLPTAGLSKGIYLLEVRQGAQKLVRTVSLSY